MIIGDEVLHVKKPNDLASQPPGQDWNVTSYNYDKYIKKVLKPLRCNPNFFIYCLYQWFSNWGPRSFWGPRDKFSGTAKHLPKKLKRRS